ncbi:MAG TPA: hypothetical protein VFQ65_20730 [Kofleriaceae bacterium]|nr:hypothetical protein [Kofleriaceae bacterium]
MNLTDARLITTAAVTSAAVAFVTVAVYEGHVKLSGAGQTVVVGPGVTFEVGPGQPPKEHRNEITMTVGGGPAPVVTPDAPKHVEFTTETIKHGFKQGPLSGDAIDATMKAIEPSLVNCIKKRSDGQLLHFDTWPDGTVGHLYASIDDPVSNACVVNVVRHARFPKASGGTSIQYSLAPPCDPDKLIDAGNAAVARGAHAAGLKSYEAALDCKYDDHTMELSFMAACGAGNVAAARRHWKTMTGEMQTRFLQICLHNHITQEQLDE